MIQHRAWLFKLATVSGLVASMLAVWLLLRELGMPASLSSAAIAEWLRGQGLLGPALLGLLMVLAVVVGPIPTLPISAASGLAFGLVGGTLIAAAGALVGALLAFFAARIMGRDFIRDRLPENPLFAVEGSQRLLFWTVLLTRLVPLFSFALISYVSGVTATTAWRFALASLIGMLPMTFVFAGLGHSFEIHPGATVSAALALLATMSLLPWYLSRYQPALLARWFQAPAPRRRDPGH